MFLIISRWKSFGNSHAYGHYQVNVHSVELCSVGYTVMKFLLYGQDMYDYISSVIG